MTNEDVLEYVNANLENEMRVYNGADGELKELSGYSIDRLKIIKSALEKQVAKKPTYFMNAPFDCPNCGGELICDDYGNRFEYCTACGQRIDWSKKE